MNTKQKGFTIIELMIAVLIVAVLVTIAYPNYMDYLRDSRRGQAQGELLELAQWMERQFTVDGRYTADTSGTKRTLPFTTSPNGGDTTYYNFAVSASTSGTYTLTATPTSAGGQNNDECGTLSVTHTGSKGAVKDSTSVSGCW